MPNLCGSDHVHHMSLQEASSLPRKYMFLRTYDVSLLKATRIIGLVSTVYQSRAH